jgi:peptide/nickel transport system substrate-binding protein
MNRTRATSTAALVLTASTLLAACSSGGAPGASAGASATPVSGGTLHFATDREPVCLDPSVRGDQPQSLIARAYLDSLFYQAEDGTIEPWLVKEWEISDDGLTYTFHLRDDVTFTDGTPFDAEAVKANFEHWLDPATQSTVNVLYVAPYQSTQVVDPHTAVVTLSRPYAAFLEVLAQSFLGIQSPQALTRGNEVNCQQPVGSGPFVVEGWAKQDRVTLVRNDDYDWAPEAAEHDGPAYAERVQWRFIPEPSTRFSALQSGEVGVIETIPPESFAVAEKSPNIEVLAGARPGVPVQLSLNTTRPPFDDLAVRQAFRYGADIRSGLDSVFFGAYGEVGGPLSPTTPFYSDATEDAYPYDPERANELLDEAGWTERDGEGYRTKDGQRLRAVLPATTDQQPAAFFLLEQIQASEKAIGLEVVIERVDPAQRTERFVSWDYDIAQGYWVTNTADALRYTYDSAFATRGGGWHSNGSGIADPELDATLRGALETTDPAAREELYAKAQQIISDAAVTVPLHLYPAHYAANTDQVRGLGVDPTLRLASLYDAWVVNP